LSTHAGPFSADIAAYVSESYINNQLAKALPTVPLNLLAFVAATFPTGFLLPDTPDRVTFQYDGVQIPATLYGNQPLIAVLDENGNLVPIVPNSAITAYGFTSPRRVSRVAWVTIVGPAQVKFPVKSTVPLTYTSEVEQTYTAFTTNEPKNPLFTWSVIDSSGKPSTAASLSATVGNQVTVTFHRSALESGIPLSPFNLSSDG
jgi:hypothetical protein